MVDADEGCKKKPYEDLSMESKILVEEMRERMRMLASKEISIEDLEGDKFIIGEVCERSAPFDFGALLVFLKPKTTHQIHFKFHTHTTTTKCLTYGTKRMI